MKIFRLVSSFVLSLILAFLIVFMQASLFINTKALQPDFYISRFEKQDFYTYLYDSLYKNFGQVSRKSNLPEELFKDIVTKDWIKEETDRALKGTLDYMIYKADKPYTLDIKAQRDSFSSNLDNYIKGLTVKIDQNSEKEIEGIKDQISNIIKSQANFIDITGVSKNSSFQQIRKALYLTYSSRSLAMVSAIILALLLLLTAERGISNYFAWIGYSLIAGGFFTFIPSVLGLTSGFMNNIAISDSSLKALAIAFIKDSLKYFSINGGIVLLTGIILTGGVAVYQGRKLPS